MIAPEDDDGKFEKVWYPAVRRDRNPPVSGIDFVVEMVAKVGKRQAATFGLERR